MPDPTHPERLVLVLADDELVQAAVAWGIIPHHAQEAPGLARWCPGLWYCPKEWMHAAGLPKGRAKPVAKRLRVLGFISPEGEAWSLILSLAAAQAHRRIKGGR